MNNIKIGIAEEQQIFRKGLILLLNSFKNIQVIHEADNGENLINKIIGNEPDIVILNHNSLISDGIKSAKEIREKFPEIKIILLSSNDDDKNVISAIENGANGYLSKDDGHLEIQNAINGVIQNNYYINERVSKALINNMIVVGKTDSSIISNPIQFTQEELKILTLISKEYTTQQIANVICKSSRTVEKHRTKMLVKVGAQNTVGLIIYAIKNKLIEI